MRQKKPIQKSLSVVEDRSIEMPKPLDQLSLSETVRKQHFSRMMTRTLHYLTSEFVTSGFEWLLPVIFSESTDPLWPDPGASIDKRIEVEIYGKTVRTTLSMIVHKIVACSLAFPKLFVLSLNVRIERSERAMTGIHAYEFTQFDFEVRNATSRHITSFVERILKGLIDSLKVKMMDEPLYRARYDDLRAPKIPFRAYEKVELEKEYGKDWESRMLLEIDDPVWVTDIPREFYDFEDFESGKWDNYDLYLPKYGEVLSGARREIEYDKITRKMERDGVRRENYKLLLKLAREGRLRSSAGAGIGIERLVSWIVGAKHVGEIQVFPKIPGIVHDL